MTIQKVSNGIELSWTEGNTKRGFVISNECLMDLLKEALNG